MIRLALGVEYDGSTYYGWQKQVGLSSVQSVLEYAISKVASEKIVIFCAGRTDAGVHAIEQVVHFDTNSIRPDSAWTFGVNNYLPYNISIRWMIRVNNKFHARFSAISRRYCYVICCKKLRPAVFCKNITHCQYVLDVNKMKAASKYLIGEQDFTSFRSSDCQSYSSLRTVYYIHIYQYREYIVIDIEANAFLHHMVRRVVSSLIAVGSGMKPVHWVHELLVMRERLVYTNIAAANGLYLVSVKYPDIFSIPVTGTIPFIFL